MKTGIELIPIERLEQVIKHGFQVQDDEFYSKGELYDAALFALDTTNDWPEKWDIYFRDKIAAKSYKERLIVAGALIAAELDRLELLESVEPKF